MDPDEIEKIPENERRKFCMELIKVISPGEISHLLQGLCNKKRASEENSPKKGSELNDLRKKQKTLDNWLIKPKGASNDNKLDETQVQTKIRENNCSSDVSNVSENRFDSSSVSMNDVNDTSSLSNKPIETSDDSILDKTHSQTKVQGDDCSIDASTSSENCSNSSRPSMNDGDYASPSCSKQNRREFFKDVVHTSNKSEKTKGSTLQDVVEESSVTETAVLESGKYKLRSKRGFSQLSDNECNSLKFDNNNLLSTDDCDTNLNAYKRNLRRKNEKSKSDKTLPLSQISQSSNTIPCSISNNAQVNTNQNQSGNVQQIVVNNNANVSPSKRSFYNRRAKMKHRLIKSSLNYSNDIIHKNINDHSDASSQNIEQNLADTSNQRNYEAYCKLNAELTKAGLNILDILRERKIQNILNDQELLNNEATVFIGSLKFRKEKILPVVHIVESKDRLLECINILKKHQ